jgi:cytochrome P450
MVHAANHVRLGAPRARREGQIALARLVARFPRIKLTAQVNYMDTLVMRGVFEMAYLIVA